MRVGNYSAHVVVDDQELEEHHIEFVTPSRATCWIASEEGKTFGIKWRCHAETRTKGNGGWVVIDGIFCGGMPMYPGRLGRGDTAEMYSFDTRTKSRAFVFSKIQTCDDDQLLNKEVPEGFGEISLEIEHGKLVKDRRVRSNKIGIPDVDSDKFHERSSKAAHHRVGFGPEEATTSRLTFSYLKVDLDDEPSIFFIFKYRPIAILRANGLVPGPGPRPDDSDPNSDPDRSQRQDLEKTELRNRIQHLKSELKRLEDLEARLSEQPRRKGIKMDSGLGKQSRSVSKVIDLTVD